jgi:hypothetical protein
MTFVHGARVAGSDEDGVAIDLSALADKGLLFRDLSRSGVPGTADYIGKAVVGGQPYKVQAFWNTSRDGSRFLKLRFHALQTPPPREPP